MLSIQWTSGWVGVKAMDAKRNGVWVLKLIVYYQKVPTGSKIRVKSDKYLGSTLAKSIRIIRINCIFSKKLMLMIDQWDQPNEKAYGLINI